MQDDFNPYAAPTATTMHPRAAEWLRSTDDPSLQKVANGLGLIYTSILIMLLSGIVFAILSAVIGVKLAPRAGNIQAEQPIDPGQIGSVTAILLIICGLGLMVGYIVNLVGSFMCLATPMETGAKGFITTSVVLTVIVLIMSIANFVVDSATVVRVVNVISLISVITFVLFLKRLAEFIGADYLARRARNILIALVGGVLLLVYTLGLALAGGRGGVAIAGFVTVMLGIGILVVFVMYANLSNNVRKAIQSGRTVYS